MHKAGHDEKKKKKNKETLAETSQRLYGTKPKEDPFYIDKEGNEYSREQYMNKFGTSMYKSKMVDGSMYATSGKRFRKTKVKKRK
jgi:hypothetical protein